MCKMCSKLTTKHGMVIDELNKKIFRKQKEISAWNGQIPL